MKPGYLLIPVFALILISIGCSKGTTSKHPKLTLESITNPVKQHDSMIAMFRFNNSGGTLGNGTFISVRSRLNQNPGSPGGNDSLYSPIPDFGGVSNGQFRLAIPYDGYLSSGGNLNDTLVFKFYALTPDSLSTDTISSPNIIVLNP